MEQDFFKSITGKRFYERDVPALVKQLQRIADALEAGNKVEEKQMRQSRKLGTLIKENNNGKVK